MPSLLDAYQLLHAGALALSEVEQAGIRIDVDYCRERLAWLDEQMRRCDRRLRSSELGVAWIKRFGTDASFGSNLQLQAVLYADLKVKPFKQTDKGDSDSVDEESLKQTNVDGILHLLRQRSLKKVKDVLGQFLRYQIDGYLYPNFNLHTVVTYRSSSSEINCQNIPKRDKWQMDVCRRAIVPSPGNVILEIDFKAIEVAIAACYHKDPTMLAYLRDPASDMHADQAIELFFLRGKNADLKKVNGFGMLRQSAKNGFIFPEFYGDYYESCAPNIACGWLKLPRLGDWTNDNGEVFDGQPVAGLLRRNNILCLSDFTEHVKKVEKRFWEERFPVYSQWRRDWYTHYQRRGSFQMKTGFVCSGVMARNAAVNYPIQGAAFHVLLKTLILMVQRTRGWMSKIIGEVHDSVLIDAVPSEVPALVEMAEHIASVEMPQIWPWIIAPLSVESAVSEVDGSWAEMKEIK